MSRFRFLRAGAASTAAAFFAAAYAAGGPQSILPEYRLSEAGGSDSTAKSGSGPAVVAAPLFAKPQAAVSGEAGIAPPRPAAPAESEAIPLLTMIKPVAAAAPTLPRSAAAEERLAAEIQRHLRRLGCYAGALHGEWDGATRAAMTSALAAANARLSVKSAEVTLLAIVEAQSDGLCRRVPAAPRIETAAAPATRSVPAASLPGMMSVGGPRTESGEASASAMPGTSLTQRAPGAAGVGGVPAKPRAETARKRPASRSSDSFFTHPLSREPY